jgi:enamine deaminase RidA (YjgF/YER057c/UK114 family)
VGIAGQPAAIRAGDFLFISGLLALTPNGIIPGLDDDKAPFFNSRIERQMEAILDTAEDICARAGTSLKNVVRAQHFMTDLGEFNAAYQVWRNRLGDVPLPFSVVRVPKPLMVEQCSVLLDLWIYCPATA